MNILTSKSFIHPVTEVYADKISLLGGVVSDLNSINNFVWQLSKIIDPQLWTCWPIRSTQNIGSGTTVYNFGLLGDFPATLVNGPTWGSNWMSFSSTNAYMTQANLPKDFNKFSFIASINTTNASSVFSAIGCGSGPSPSVNNSTYISTTAVSNNAHLVYGNGSTVAGITPRLSSGPRFFGVTTGGSGGNIIAYQDAAQLSNSAQGTASPTLENFTIAARPHDKIGSNNVECSFAAVFKTVLTPTQYLQIREIYKNTLGQGLGLS